MLRCGAEGAASSGVQIKRPLDSQLPQTALQDLKKEVLVGRSKLFGEHLRKLQG